MAGSRRSTAVTVVLVAATCAGVRFTPFVSNAGPNFAIAVFTVADRCPRRSSLVAASIAAVATWAVLPLGVLLHPGQGQDAVQLAAAVPAWLAGDIVRVRRRYRQRLELESRRRAAEQEGRVRAEERLRLSRDVHDVVSHSLSVIAVRSGVARLLLDEQPGEARVALATIETASRSALDDLRQLLRRIRDPGAEEETAALPTLGDLPALVGRLRDSGLDLSYRCLGEPRTYSTAVELSAYRIAQEALTNVVKHAPGARASVTVTRGEAELTIAVTDDGASAAGRFAQSQPAVGSAATVGVAATVTGRRLARSRDRRHAGTGRHARWPAHRRIPAGRRLRRRGQAAGQGARPVTSDPGDGYQPASQAADPAGQDNEIQVLIADDEALVRAGFRILVDSATDLRVVGEARDGVQAVRQAAALRPDVVLMDIRMPVMHGLEATKVILDACQVPLPRILIVTTFDEDENVFEALRSGASGFILKDTPPEQLLEAIRIIAAGEALLTPSVTRRLISEFARRPRGVPRWRARRSSSSPRASARCSNGSQPVSRTLRSRPGCTCPSRRSRLTSAGCWPN